MRRLELGRRYGFIDCAGTSYWGTVDATNQTGVVLSDVLFALKAEPDKLRWMPDGRTAELEWWQVLQVVELIQ